MARIRRMLITLAGLWLALLVGFTLAQRGLYYVPATDRPAVPSGFAEVTATTADGLALSGLWLAPLDPDAPILVHFHGNGGHHGQRAFLARAWHRLGGFGVLLAGYRGYGGNPGQPSEAGWLADGRAWLDRAAALGGGPERLVIHGESMGAALAVALAGERPSRALILIAPFTRLIDVVNARMPPVLPWSLMLLDRWDSLGRMARVSVPVFISHGTRDTVVPEALGRRLFAAAPEPKEYLSVEGAEHSELARDDVVAAGIAFVRAHPLAPPGPAPAERP